MTAEQPTRRGFLGMFAAALVMPVVAPIVVPKRSFFSFFLPKRLIHPDHFDLQAQIDALSETGGVVQIPAGILIARKSIILPDNVSFAFLGNATLIDCCFKGSPTGIKDPKGIFVDDEDDRKGNNLITGCSFDFAQNRRPMFEFPETRPAG